MKKKNPLGDDVFVFEVDPGDLKAWPLLVEHLTAVKYDDGTERQTSSLTIFFESGRLKVALSDRDNGVVGYKTLGRLQDVFTMLEEALESDDFDWRPGSRNGGRKK